MYITNGTTPEELQKNPSILLRMKGGLADPPVQPFEGKLGAVIWGGKYFVTTPNSDRIYHPPGKDRVTFKQDMRLGEHDPMQWPQPFMPEYPHLACFATPGAVDDPKTSAMKVLFHKAHSDDFERIPDAALLGLGHLRPELLQQAKNFMREVIEPHFLTWIAAYDALPDEEKSPTKIPVFTRLRVLMYRDIRHLEGLPLSRTQVLFVFSELQRNFMEYVACRDYIQSYRPRMEGLQPRVTVNTATNVMGAFVLGPEQADSFVRAGIPVYIVREAQYAGTVRVDALVEPLMANDRLCLEDAYHQFRVSYSGPVNSVHKYRAFASYSDNYLTSSSTSCNPFELTVPSRAASATSQSNPSASLSSTSTAPSKRVNFINSRHQRGPYPRSSPNATPGASGRDKFAEPVSPIVPPPIPAWRDALAAVNHDRSRCLLGLEERKSAAGYVLPDPGLFVGVGEERRGVYFYNWLKNRPILLFRLTSTSISASRASNQLWRQVLGMSDSPTASSFPTSSSQGKTRAQKYREMITEMLKDALQSDPSLQVNPDDLHNIDVFWHGQALSFGRLPEVLVTQEIMWELYELNFRFEFLALDQRAHDPAISTEGRENLLLACFPGPVGRSLLIAELDFADQGFAADNIRDRTPHLIALKNVMKTWRNFGEAVEKCVDVNLSVTKELCAYSEGELLAAETALARFYAQSFFDFFGRAAIVPRRLPRLRRRSQEK